MSSTITSILQSCGLAEEEIKLYLAALEMGAQPASVIAKKAGVPRSNAYNYISLLIEKGLFNYFISGRVRFFSACAPQNLTSFVERKKREFDGLRERVEQIIPDLLLLQNPQMNSAKTHFFEGEKGVIEIYEQTLQCKEKQLLFISSQFSFSEFTTQEYEKQYYIPTRMERGIKLYQLIFDSPACREYKKNDAKQMRESRFLPEKFSFTSTAIMYDDKVAFITGQKSFFAVVIESEEIAHMMKQIFWVTWETRPK